MVKQKKLDYLLIPTGWGRQRRKRAEKELKKRNIKKVLILNGANSEEDILYLGKKLKGGERVGFVTFPLHYLEYKDIIRKARKENKFPPRVKTENIETEETAKQDIYGILGLLDEKLKDHINYSEDEHKDSFKDKIRIFVKKLLG